MVDYETYEITDRACGAESRVVRDKEVPDSRRGEH